MVLYPAMSLLPSITVSNVADEKKAIFVFILKILSEVTS